MKQVQIRLLEHLYNTILTDLARPHPFVQERVGFVFTRQGQAAHNTTLIVPVDYSPVADNLYAETAQGVGATIKSEVIRQTMQRLLHSGEGAFHVHLHAHRGRPRFSRIDLKDIPQIARSFQNVSPAACHGAIVLSRDNGVGLVVATGPEDDPARPTITRNVSISIIGSPMRFFF